MKTATEDMLRMNLREMRARTLASSITREMEEFIPPAFIGDFHRKLTALLFESGAEVITDIDRENAGLLPRDDYGITADELRAIEMHRMNLMMPKPIQSSTTGGKA